MSNIEKDNGTQNPKTDSVGLWLAILGGGCFLLPWVARYPLPGSTEEISRISVYAYSMGWMIFLLLLCLVTIFLRYKRMHKYAKLVSALACVSSIGLGTWMMIQAKRDGPALLNILNSPDQPSLGLYIFCFLV